MLSCKMIRCWSMASPDKVLDSWSPPIWNKSCAISHCVCTRDFASLCTKQESALYLWSDCHSDHDSPDLRTFPPDHVLKYGALSLSSPALREANCRSTWFWRSIELPWQTQLTALKFELFSGWRMGLFLQHQFDLDRPLQHLECWDDQAALDVGDQRSKQFWLWEQMFPNKAQQPTWIVVFFNYLQLIWHCWILCDIQIATLVVLLFIHQGILRYSMD